MTGSANGRVTAGVLIIGDEILSGRTQDTNLRDIARYLGVHGVDLAEARTVGDTVAEIVEALDALRGRYDYVITTGGIGPTHDDITADAVAATFGVELLEHPEILAMMAARWGEAPNAQLLAGWAGSGSNGCTGWQATQGASSIGTASSRGGWSSPPCGTCAAPPPNAWA